MQTLQKRTMTCVTFCCRKKQFWSVVINAVGKHSGRQRDCTDQVISAGMTRDGSTPVKRMSRP